MVTSTQRPKISVLMPVYNAECFLTNAIESILNQSFGNFELLICDDGSTDNSWSILSAARDERIKIYRNETNLGVVLTTNRLFKLCQGKLITFQDADDWSEKNRLELQEKAFRTDPDLRLCGSQRIYIKGKKLQESSFPLNRSALINALENGETCICHGPSVMFRSALIKKHGVYRLFFDRIGAEHLDFYWRMIEREKFINLPYPLYNYRATQDSLTQNTHNNPLQFYSTKLAFLAYWQRKLTGVDFLENKEETKKITEKLLKHHVQDPSLTPSMLASTQLAFGNTERFIALLRQSLLSYGLTSANLKAIITAAPLFLLCTFAPKSLKRFLVRKSNRRFLAKHGINQQ